MKVRTLGLFLIALFSCVALAAEKVEPATALPESVPAPIRNAVEAKGYRVTSDGAPVADIWLRTAVPTGPKKEGGALYPELEPGTFVGVLSFPKGGSDFRGQDIPAGFYALRYELLPNDAYHMGVAPNRDFFLLVPVAADPGPSIQVKYDELVKLSAKASGTQHPAVMEMMPPHAAPQPTASTNPDGYVVFSAKLKTSSGELPFSLVVKGSAPQ